MRRFSVLCAASLAVSAFAATTSAQANPYHLIRWSDTGFCQIWDESVPVAPWPANFTVVSKQLPTFADALNRKDGMVHAGKCAF